MLARLDKCGNAHKIHASLSLNNIPYFSPKKEYQQYGDMLCGGA
jgi:hypothetical protein